MTCPETLDAFFSGLEGCEVIVLHMAGVITIQQEVAPAVYDVNVNGTRHIIEKCREYGVRRLVYVSSVHAIPEPDRPATVTEIGRFSAGDVVGAYARTKAEATQLVLDAVRDGLDAVVVHPSGITGPGDNGRNHLNQLMLMYLQHRLPAGVRGGYDLVDVRDVAEGVVNAAEKGRSGECYLLSNRYVSIPELIEYMRAATGRRLRLGSLPLWLARAFVPLAEAVARAKRARPLFTAYALRVMGTKGRFSHAKATRELGYHPRDIRETVADTIAYLRQGAAGGRKRRRALSRARA